jgi:hypothetical protein
VFILLFALGFVLRGVDVMDHDMWSAVQKWIIAAGISIVDFFYIPIREALGPRFASTASAVATDFRWWVTGAFIVLIFAALGPAIERHGWPRWPLPTPTVPSADEIASAVVRALPKGDAPVATASAPVPQVTEPYVNPTRSDGVKWRVAQGIRSKIIRGGLTTDCYVTIVQLPQSYAEDYAADFKRILDVIGWKYDARLAVSPVSKGLSVRAVNKQGPSRECGEALANRLQNDGRTRSGSRLGAFLHLLPETEAPDYLKECTHAACIEVDFGLDDGQ